MHRLVVEAAALQALTRHTEAGYPHEVVGLMAGHRADGRVLKAVPLDNENRSSPHNRYQVSGLRLWRAEQEIERQGLELVGYYHSHPDHPPQFSSTDLEQALPNMSYLIVGVREGRVAESRAWQLEEDRSSMRPIPLEVVESVRI